ncbi:MAG: hypothetical protein K1X31_04635 [Gemmatimonadaceae bacterium]|nr:hypothetical protein [Gemmatimonadaceae bacterium]
MPNLAANHPQVVHFAIALLLLGTAFRVISLTGRLAFTRHAAAVLLLLGTVSAAVSVKSGLDAHGPAERIPGARSVVQEHEEYGITTRNIFFAVAVLEIIALGLGASAGASKHAKWAYVASAVIGLYGSSVLYEAAEHGGELVYEYAGGPGLRTGKPEDVERLLLAGLYHQSMADRKAKKHEDAARLIEEMARRFPADTTIALMRVESLLLDKQDAAGAVAAARATAVDDKSPRWASRKAGLLADAFVALGQPDSARAALQPVVQAFPQNTRLKAKLDSIH